MVMKRTDTPMAVVGAILTLLAVLIVGVHYSKDARAAGHHRNDPFISDCAIAAVAAQGAKRQKNQAAQIVEFCEMLEDLI